MISVHVPQYIPSWQVIACYNIKMFNNVTVQRNLFYRGACCTFIRSKHIWRRAPPRVVTVDPVGIHISLHSQWTSYKCFSCRFSTTLHVNWRTMTSEPNTNSLTQIEFTSVFSKRQPSSRTLECSLQR